MSKQFKEKCAREWETLGRKFVSVANSIISRERTVEDMEQASTRMFISQKWKQTAQIDHRIKEIKKGIKDLKDEQKAIIGKETMILSLTNKFNKP